MGFIVGKAYPIIKSMAESGNADAKKLLDGLESMDQDKVDEMVSSLLGGGNKPSSFTDVVTGVEKAEVKVSKPKVNTTKGVEEVASKVGKKDGTYVLNDEGEPELVNLEEGRQVSFFRPEITDEQIEKIEGIIGDNLGEQYFGVYGGSGEMSYKVDDTFLAETMARIFNQVSMWDNEKGKEVKNPYYDENAKVDYDAAAEELKSIFEFRKKAEENGKTKQQIENFERTALIFANLNASERILASESVKETVNLARMLFLRGYPISEVRGVLNVENYDLGKEKKQYPVKNRENLALARNVIDRINLFHGGQFSVEEDLKTGRPSSWNAMDDIIRVMRLEPFDNTEADYDDKKNALSQVMLSKDMSDTKRKLYNGIIKVIDNQKRKKKED